MNYFSYPHLYLICIALVIQLEFCGFYIKDKPPDDAIYFFRFHLLNRRTRFIFWLILTFCQIWLNTLLTKHYTNANLRGARGHLHP